MKKYMICIAMLTLLGACDSEQKSGQKAKPELVESSTTPPVSAVNYLGVSVAQIKQRGLPFWLLRRFGSRPECPTFIQGPVKECKSGDYHFFFDRQGQLVKHHVLDSQSKSPRFTATYQYFESGYTKYRGPSANKHVIDECKEEASVASELIVTCYQKNGSYKLWYGAETGKLLEESKSFPALQTFDKAGRQMEMKVKVYTRDWQKKVVVRWNIDSFAYQANGDVKVTQTRHGQDEVRVFNAIKRDHHGNVTTWHIDGVKYDYNIEYVYWE